MEKGEAYLAFYSELSKEDVESALNEARGRVKMPSGLEVELLTEGDTPTVKTILNNFGYQAKALFEEERAKGVPIPSEENLNLYLIKGEKEETENIEVANYVIGVIGNYAREMGMITAMPFYQNEKGDYVVYLGDQEDSEKEKDSNEKEE